MTSINSAGTVKLIETIASAMFENKNKLIELDSAIGDGDLGLTMERGFKAAYQLSITIKDEQPGKILMKSGMEIAKVAPSTMGTLMGTGFMRGGKAVLNKEELTADDLTEFFCAFLQGVIDRGKAKTGEKTILDVLDPLVKEMKNTNTEDISEVLQAAVNGAKAGLEAEKNMISQHGKAAVFREKTLNQEDPGSVAVYIMVEACLKSLND
ncbi:MAG: dihydroxyacetone kinase subunit DhaL [Spirochaetales bacterium]|nr:dihydroxyacetone kinase subunit DhaL [Spirochaetales bacterium]